MYATVAQERRSLWRYHLAMELRKTADENRLLLDLTKSRTEAKIQHRQIATRVRMQATGAGEMQKYRVSVTTYLLDPE